MRKTTGTVIAAVAALALGSSALATMEIQKEYKAKDPKASCASCHVDKMPKKEAKGEPFGEVGKWLMAQKAKNKAAEVDVAWLKDYKAK